MIDRSEIERLLYPRSIEDIRRRYTSLDDDEVGKETEMTKLKDAINGELEAEALLGPEAAQLARDSYDALGIRSLSEYVALAYPGGLDELRDLRRQQRAEKVALSAKHRDSPARRMALEMADELGVDRAIVGAEFDRLVEEGALT